MFGFVIFLCLYSFSLDYEPVGFEILYFYKCKENGINLKNFLEL